MGGYKDHRERTERAVFLPAVLSPEVWASRWWHSPPACTGLVATHKKRKLACGFTGYIDLTSNRASPQSPHFFLPSSSQGLCQNISQDQTCRSRLKDLAACWLLWGYSTVRP